MIEFLDGPAAGVHLMLRRAPIYLRVVRGPRGKWDALDQLDDAPAPEETIFAYKVEGEVGHMHLLRRPGPSGYFAMAKYRAVPDQPEDATLRDNTAWRQWCLAQTKEAAHG